MEDRLTRATEAIEDLIRDEDQRLIGVWNRHVEDFAGDVIHDMDEFDAVFSDATPMVVANATCGDDFIPIETWFSVGFDGCAYSYGELSRSPIDPNSLADYAVRTGDDCGLPELRAILAD